MEIFFFLSDKFKNCVEEAKIFVKKFSKQYHFEVNYDNIELEYLITNVMEQYDVWIRETYVAYRHLDLNLLQRICLTKESCD